MITNEWDVDLAVLAGPLDEVLDGQPTIDRYGITIEQERAGEPLAVALAQEEPEFGDEPVDNQWTFVDPEWDADRRLRSGMGDPSPEAAAMHLALV
ncbi:MAG: hypothetical protein QOC82_3339 [Frankiaceae bacterium]|jgi:hypothetical protein|nr:hypothetical protein [Frankiaceae bacterium]MDQ1698739.1 hypothetical protein [Frankiaceae bacterium]